MAELKIDCTKMADAFEKTAKERGLFVGWWVPVSERLPEDHKDVLIYLSSDQICVGCYNSHRLPFSNNVIGWGASYTHNWCSNDVIAWMPLPESYTAESEVANGDKGTNRSV